MRKLEGKIVMVTGASSGVGAALARKLSELGATPVLVARRADKLADVAGQITGEKLVIQADVTQAEEVADAVNRCLARYGRVDALVNNAGVGIFEPFLEMPMEGFEQMMDVNYLSVVRCTKAVLPHMLGKGQGHIVNVVSVAGKIGTAKATAYSASKHAALGLTNGLRAELAGTGIRVSSVNPGPIDTPFFDIADPSGHYKHNVGWYMLSPEKVAEAVCRVLVSGKADVTLPFTASLGAKALQLFPNLLSGIAGRLLNRK